MVGSDDCVGIGVSRRMPTEMWSFRMIASLGSMRRQVMPDSRVELGALRVSRVCSEERRLAPDCQTLGDRASSQTQEIESAQ
jgi:hypothetical protein